MNFLSLAKSRYSVRKYSQDPISDNALNYILEAGRVAPSAVNYQPWLFLVVRDKKNLAGMHRLYHREWFRNAPVVVILLANHDEAWKRADGKDHADIDVAIAADHMTLAAAEIGLGSCWVCNFDKQKTIEYFNLPDHLEPVVFLPIGIPASEPDEDRHDDKRKPIHEVVRYEQWDNRHAD